MIRPARSKNGSTTWLTVRAGRPSNDAITFTRCGPLPRIERYFCSSGPRPSSSICSSRTRTLQMIQRDCGFTHWIGKLGNMPATIATQFVAFLLLFVRSAAATLREFPIEDISLDVAKCCQFLVAVKLKSQNQPHSITKRLKQGNIHPSC